MAAPVAAEGRYYVECAANITTVLQQVAGALGDELDWIWIGAGAGTVTLKDGGTTFFTWGAQTVERFVPLNIRSRVGAWSLVTPAGVVAVTAGKFS